MYVSMYLYVHVSLLTVNVITKTYTNYENKYKKRIRANNVLCTTECLYDRFYNFIHIFGIIK